ncbi:MAG: hypothetical protein KC776_33645 [Myxococcales bacterium]|nr:hypothetical protein [Myxococcales bacterium]
MKLGAGACVAALVCFSCRWASARPLSDALTVEPESACLSRQALADAVSTWLEKSELDDRIAIRVESEGDPPRNVSFVLKKDGKPAAFRQFLDPPKECSDLRAVIALSIALALDNALLTSLGVEPETPKPPPAPAPAPRPKSKPSSHPAPPPSPSVEVAAFAEAFAALRLLPEPAFGGLLGLGAAWPVGLEVRLSAMGTAPTRIAISNADAELQLAAARVDGCLRQRLAPVFVRGCAGGAVGHVVAEGVGFDRDFGVALPWTALGARVDVLIPVSPELTATAGVDGTLPLTRSTIRVVDESGGDVASRVMPPAGIAAIVGVSIALPR